MNAMELHNVKDAAGITVSWVLFIIVFPMIFVPSVLVMWGGMALWRHYLGWQDARIVGFVFLVLSPLALFTQLCFLLLLCWIDDIWQKRESNDHETG